MSLNANQYSKLVAQGRAKAINVPWTEEEMAQIVACKNPAEREKLIADLRAGVATEKVEKTSEQTGDQNNTPSKPFSKMRKPELLENAKKLGVEVPEGATAKDIVALLEETIKAK